MSRRLVARSPSADRRRPRGRSRRDGDTRARLLEAARALFPERGFDGVTVRDICREANASLALVNYHFGDKLGLYEEVVNEAIRLIRNFNEETMRAPAGSSAEEQLGYFVRAFVGRMLRPAESETWVHNLMEHEIRRPTAASARIGRHAIAPRIRYLAGVIGELLAKPPHDLLVLQCVGSVHGLCLIYARMREMPESLRAAISEKPWTVDVDSAAEHVLAFSLAGIRAIRSGEDDHEAR
jgi:TetR/AcrR family transcriptional regulator, regulator of cefoperazone and chloramphenicol sensitivity